MSQKARAFALVFVTVGFFWLWHDIPNFWDIWKFAMVGKSEFRTPFFTNPAWMDV